MTRTGNTNNAVRMCVKKAIKVRLKQLIVRLMQLKNLVAWQPNFAALHYA